MYETIYFSGAKVLLSGEPSPKSLFVFRRISAGSSGAV